MDVIWAYQNDNGGFKDSTGKTRKLTMVTKDDGYDSARTIPLVDELIDSEKVFMVWTLGSPNTLKTYDKLNQRCIPQTFSMTGHPAWGDPVNHPWTTGLALSYTSEAILLRRVHREARRRAPARDGKITVGALVMNNDFGKAYDVGFKGYLANSPIKDKIDYQPELMEPTAPTITDPMTTIASKNPEVFIAMTAGTSCTQAYTEAAQNGMKENGQVPVHHASPARARRSWARPRSAVTVRRRTAGGSPAAATSTATPRPRTTTRTSCGAVTCSPRPATTTRRRAASSSGSTTPGRSGRRCRSPVSSTAASTART